MRHDKYMADVKMLKFVEPLPPWHPARTRISIHEVKAYMRKLYNIATSGDVIENWTIKGVEDPRDPSKKIYLKVHRFCGKFYVHKQDLIAFCEAI